MRSELLLLLSLSYVFCLFAWFEALTATESDGTLLMEQYVPCHICAASRLEDECGEKAARVVGLQRWQAEQFLSIRVDPDCNS